MLSQVVYSTQLSCDACCSFSNWRAYISQQDKAQCFSGVVPIPELSRTQFQNTFLFISWSICTVKTTKIMNNNKMRNMFPNSHKLLRDCWLGCCHLVTSRQHSSFQSLAVHIHKGNRPWWHSSVWHELGAVQEETLQSCQCWQEEGLDNHQLYECLTQ